jgi:hypothetical protein
MTLQLNLTSSLEMRLRSEASARGQDVEAYIVQTLEEKLGPAPNDGRNRKSTAEFDAQRTELEFDGPTLPADFSRADIYDDHR